MAMMLGGIRIPRAPPADTVPTGDIPVIPPFEHGRDCYQAHGHGGHAADPGHGCEDRTDENRARRQPPRDPLKPSIHHLIEVVGQARDLQHVSHKNKEGYGGQNEVAPVGQQCRGYDQQTFGAPQQETVKDGRTGQTESDGQPHQDQDHQGREKQNCQQPKVHQKSP